MTSLLDLAVALEVAAERDSKGSDSSQFYIKLYYPSLKFTIKDATGSTVKPDALLNNLGDNSNGRKRQQVFNTSGKDYSYEA